MNICFALYDMHTHPVEIFMHRNPCATPVYGCVANTHRVVVAAAADAVVFAMILDAVSILRHGFLDVLFE